MVDQLALYTRKGNLASGSDLSQVRQRRRRSSPADSQGTATYYLIGFSGGAGDMVGGMTPLVAKAGALKGSVMRNAWTVVELRDNNQRRLFLWTAEPRLGCRLVTTVHSHRKAARPAHGLLRWCRRRQT